MLETTAVSAQPTARDPLARLLQPRVESAYALVRIVAGLMFAFHGVQGLFGVLSPFQAELGTQLWIGKVIELVAGVAIAAGLLTRSAAFLASGTMAVAYIQFHWKFQLGEQFLPAVNQGEPALLYSVLFLFIACRGAGRWSTDQVLTRPRQ
jgi:putative oxidoreductase